MEHLLENNQVLLIGKVVSTPVHSHEVYKENFYVLNLEVPRLSNTMDILTVTISERLFNAFEISEGDVLKITGQFRSYNVFEEGRTRLFLTVFALKVESASEEDLRHSLNTIKLKGFVCREASYRTTPMGREISDLLVAVNRGYRKSDYIPCIAWGRNANYCKFLPVGSCVEIEGRIQSRSYQKTLEDGSTITRTAYEVSVSKMATLLEDNTSPEASTEEHTED